jgi:cobalt-precorrin-5B (C1)-methyltransferase
MRDPVSGFEYPAEWVQRCPDAENLRLVEAGLAVLTSTGAVLLRGFTTGTTAAAAAKAGVLSLAADTDSVDLTLPCGLLVTVAARGCGGTGSAEKYSGDYPSDVTAGLEFIAKATRQPGSITIIFGEGIGRFTRDTPRYRKGAPAVSPPALSAIVRSVQEALDTIGETGIGVCISAPRGAAVAERTLNPKVGVEGGISVLGTTGLVEPWDEHLTESMTSRIALSDNPVITTGRIGLRFSRLLYPDREVILVGGKIRQALDAACGSVTLFGLPALILRHINPDILAGTGFLTVEELSASPQFAGIVAATLAGFRKIRPNVTVVLINRDGTVIGESP